MSMKTNDAKTKALQLRPKAYTLQGTQSAWYKGRDLAEDERERFRSISLASKEAKAKALRGDCDAPKHYIPQPKLDPSELMPQLPENGLRALSLFSGGGGLDIGFERAGFEHVASYDILEIAGSLLKQARPDWQVFSGDEGDVTQVKWKDYRGEVDVLHGGPPCQPFSHAGNRLGADDVRDMIPEFVRAVKLVCPKAFICENVSGLATKRFESYLETTFLAPLGERYRIFKLTLEAQNFGVPQRRKRIFLVGFSRQRDASFFIPPLPKYTWGSADGEILRTMGAREALGLDDIGFDALAPTLRSGLTGPRHSTSIVNSATAARQWSELKIWPNGVAPTREAASAFIAKNGHFRLSIQDCMLLQGFPKDWPINPPVYKALGLIGNSVAPPMGYAVASAVARALHNI